MKYDRSAGPVRVLVAVAVGAAALCLLAPGAGAHISPVDPTAPAGGYATVELQVGHGCDGAATERISVSIDERIASATAEAVPGWEVTYEKEPAEGGSGGHGESSERVSVVTWTATGEPLPSDQFQRFGISMKMPDAPGETLLLPVEQQCVGGVTQLWADADHDSEHPAPSVELVASTDADHGGSGDDAGASTEDAADGVTADVEAAADDSVTSESGDDVLARVLGVVAVVLALGALVAALRRKRS